jgi:membrane fusion protein
VREQIFRQEAIDAKRPEILGDTLELDGSPPRFTFYLSLLLSLAFVAFLVFGSFPKYVTVKGVVIPDQGLLKVQLQRSGTIRKIEIKEGQSIEKGQLLFHITQDRITLDGDELGSKKLAGIDQLMKLNHESLSLAHKNSEEERAKLSHEIRSIQRRIVENLEKSKIFGERIKIKENDLNSLRDLFAKDLVNLKEVKDTQVALLALQEQAHDIEGTTSELQMRLNQRKFDLQQVQTKLKETSAQLGRSDIELESQRGEIDLTTAQTIISPVRGRVVGLNAIEGQTVDSATTLLHIVPEGAKLAISLPIPSRSMGQIQAGNRVIYSLDPYPPSLFGYRYGQVISVSQSIILPRDFSANDMLAVQEPSYRVLVAIDEDFQQVKDQRTPLQPGTGVDARIVIEDRKIYEWIFQPLLQLLRGGL